jgi:hypothetical protein
MLCFLSIFFKHQESMLKRHLRWWAAALTSDKSSLLDLTAICRSSHTRGRYQHSSLFYVLLIYNDASFNVRCYWMHLGTLDAAHREAVLQTFKKVQAEEREEEKRPETKPDALCYFLRRARAGCYCPVSARSQSWFGFALRIFFTSSALNTYLLSFSLFEIPLT